MQRYSICYKYIEDNLKGINLIEICFRNVYIFYQTNEELREESQNGGEFRSKS